MLALGFTAIFVVLISSLLATILLQIHFAFKLKVEISDADQIQTLFQAFVQKGCSENSKTLGYVYYKFISVFLDSFLHHLKGKYKEELLYLSVTLGCKRGEELVEHT